MKTLGIIGLLIGFVSFIYAQDYKLDPINLDYKQSSIKKSYFNEIKVLDNRCDTSLLFIAEDFSLPAKTFYIPNLSTAFEDFLREAIKPLAKPGATLVLNVNQLRITNKRYIYRRDRDTKNGFGFALRYVIIFSGDVYEKKEGDSYRKILEIHNAYYSHKFTRSDIGHSISRILVDVVDGINNYFDPQDKTQLKGLKKQFRQILYDSSYVNYYLNDSSLRTLDEINLKASQRWAKLPILSVAGGENGFCTNFDDFRNNDMRRMNFHLVYEAPDSIYRLVETDTVSFAHSPPIWAIRYGGELYLRIHDNSYVKMSIEDGSLKFHIPMSLPSMYDILSSEAMMLEESSIPMPNTGNPVLDVGQFLTNVALNSATKPPKGLKRPKNPINAYRNCRLDMDTGDILYN